MIVAHLGSGASMCALANGRSVESTMGFTALDGLPDGHATGSDSIRAFVLYLMCDKGHERGRRCRRFSIPNAD